MKKTVYYILALLIGLLGSSCKKEFSTIGENIIVGPKFKGKLFDQAQVIAYDKNVEKVLSLNSSVITLGAYNNPVFGTLTADFVSVIQTGTSTFKSDGFGDNVRNLSAKLIIPFFSHTEEEEGTKIFVTDSVFGSEPINLKIHELTYFLNPLDPNSDFEKKQEFYSDFDFSPYKGQMICDSSNYIPDFSPYITYERNTDGSFKLDDNGHKIVKDSLGPHFVAKLDTTFFRHKIFDHSGENLITNPDSFRNYFRGLYVDAEAINDDGRLMLMNLSNAKIILSYIYDETDDHGTPSDTSDDTTEQKYKEIELSLKGLRNNMSINSYTTTFNATASSAINSSDETNGDDKLYIRGDAGVETIIKLFNNQQLRQLRKNNWLINQAELWFYVDETTMNNINQKPSRLYLYDYDKSMKLVDIYDNANTTPAGKIPAKMFDGILGKDEHDNAIYRFRITNHIKNVLKKDSVNVRLGLRVVSGTNVFSQETVREIQDPDNINPLGTVLYGTTTSTTKKPVLKIYYSKPE